MDFQLMTLDGLPVDDGSPVDDTRSIVRTRTGNNGSMWLKDCEHKALVDLHNCHQLESLTRSGDQIGQILRK